ncbi:hypothetical protein G3O08_01300 [Cryomorpha ignava]|uniref:Tetratricopeptide repeat protein n=1 Tax=Cryomorpha ignava TaxID=101383 RepID=A0A7K3WKS6_9FLAO|nr:hypothetical protein [Cryomorpha ignava]NEN22138.1 hypothetical protein [Cryomorpha ignava]
MKKLLYILIICFVAYPALLEAQIKDQIEAAYVLYNAGDYEAAADAINEVVESPKGETSKVAWHIRGFIYKDIYIKSEQNNSESKARDEAIYSHKKCIENDLEGTLVNQSRNAITYLSVSYYNDAIEIMDARNPIEIGEANNLYEKYKEITLYLYPDSVMTSSDIDYFLAMSTAHRKIYERDRAKNEANWEISNDYLTRVLDLDPQNWAALYSKSVSYYNKGAFNLERLPEAQGITDIYRIESESMRSIEFALPYMMKAYEIDPDKIEAIKGLKTILFNLNRVEESNEMQKLELQLEDKAKD